MQQLNQECLLDTVLCNFRKGDILLRMFYLIMVNFSINSGPRCNIVKEASYHIPLINIQVNHWPALRLWRNTNNEWNRKYFISWRLSIQRHSKKQKVISDPWHWHSVTNCVNEWVNVNMIQLPTLIEHYPHTICRCE